MTESPADYYDNSQYPYSFEIIHRFRHPPREIWKLISDTDRVNRAIGIPPINYTHDPLPEGGSRRLAEVKIFPFTLQWEEHPYEWVEPLFFRSEREYERGPFEKGLFYLEITDTDDGGCEARVIMAYKPKNWILGQLGKIEVLRLKKKFPQIYSYLDDYLDRKKQFAFQPLPQDIKIADKESISRLSRRLQMMGIDETIANEIATWVYQASPQALLAMRPFQLAKKWEQDPIEVLEAFLLATKDGLFTMSWDLLCPSCRGAKSNFNSLENLETEAHCDACNIVYGINFDKSVELTFSPADPVRELDLYDYCVGGPQNTPHYVMQLRLSPKEERTVKIELLPGQYIFRSLQASDRFSITVEEGVEEGSEAVKIDFTTEEREEEKLTLPPGETLFTVKSHHLKEIQAMLENASWQEEICTASFVTSLQEFRDTFSSEVLRPGLEVSIEAMAIAFTDLKGSTAMYNEVGEAAAFRLVQDHFDILTRAVKKHSGGVVKTIGDAVMASFTQPHNAVLAALEMHRGLEEWNEEHPPEEQLTLKVGIHFGSCYAVNLNDKFDYFGSTVNLAARTEGMSEGNDIILTERMMEEEKVKDFLEKEPEWEVRSIERKLKGFEETFSLFQVQWKKKATEEEGSS